ncbi:hypothetical protein FRC03_002386 [Tulasnella sp. 419]|nr:hypothetical protein FRC03_002386 [Tulasnella sp. 419]
MTPLSGELSTYHDRLTLFESGDLNSRRTVVFVGGLGDGLQCVPYLNALSSFLASIGWSLVQVNLSSSYNQFGLSSLDNDVEELGYAFEYLYREKSKTDIVLMGHSTGCQDAIHYLVTKPTSSSSPRPQIKSAILQAPVSDQEFFKSKYPGDHEARIWVKKATDMVLQGNGNEWLPIDASRSLVGEGEQLTPFTAYRYWSLFADG